jgi:hypothetical protein
MYEVLTQMAKGKIERRRRHGKRRKKGNIIRSLNHAVNVLLDLYVDTGRQISDRKFSQAVRADEKEPTSFALS